MYLVILVNSHAASQALASKQLTLKVNREQYESSQIGYAFVFNGLFYTPNV